MSIIKNYEPNTDTAKLLIVKLLNFSSEYKQYAYCIYSLAKRLKKENHKLETFTLNAFESRDFLGAEISYIYPLLQGVEQKRALTYSLAKIDNLYDYIHFINYNDINEYSVERFKYLMEQNKSELSLDRICYILAELRKKPLFHEIHTYIDEFAKNNGCMNFFLSPYDYKQNENVEVPWILTFDEDNRKKLFKKEVYKNKLKQYICDPLVQEGEKQKLLKYL